LQGGLTSHILLIETCTFTDHIILILTDKYALASVIVCANRSKAYRNL
jgi:hypothetical protein